MEINGRSDCMVNLTSETDTRLKWVLKKVSVFLTNYMEVLTVADA